MPETSTAITTLLNEVADGKHLTLAEQHALCAAFDELSRDHRLERERLLADKAALREALDALWRSLPMHTLDPFSKWIQAVVDAEHPGDLAREVHHQ